MPPGRKVFKRRRRANLEAVDGGMRVSSPLEYTGSQYSGIHGNYSGPQLMDAVVGAAADATRVISNRVAGLSLRVYWDRYEEGEVQTRSAIDHPLQSVIDKPTLDQGTVTQTMAQLLSLVVQQYLNVGESYLLVVHDELGAPKNLYPMRPGSTQPIVEGGRVVRYTTFTNAGTSRKLEPRDVVRIWDPDPVDMFACRGVLERHAHAYNLNKFSLETWQNFFKYDATPKLVLEAKDGAEMLPNPDEREAFERAWKSRANHLDGSAMGAPLLVKPGWQAKELSAQNETSSGIEMIKFSRDLILQAYGVPPAKLGDIENVNRSSADTIFYTFDRSTIVPITDTISDALTNQLAMQFPAPEGLRLRIGFEPFVDPDADFELQRDQADATLKIRSINEIRAQRQTPQDPSSWGDLPVGQMQDVPYTGEIPELDISEVEVELPPVDVGEAEPQDEVPLEDEGRAFHGLSELRSHFEPRRAWERAVREMTQWEPRFEVRARAVTERQEQETIGRSRKAGPPSAAKDGAKYREAIFPTEGDPWKNLFEQVVEPLRRALFRISADETTRTLSGRPYTVDDAGRETLREQGDAYRSDVNATTSKHLDELVERARAEKWDAKEFERHARELFALRKKQAKVQAHTEVGAAWNAGTADGSAQAGNVDALRWVSQFDDVVRATHWDATGQVRAVGATFTIGGQSARYPLDPRLSAEERANCRCITVPVLEEIAFLAGGKE